MSNIDHPARQGDRVKRIHRPAHANPVVTAPVGTIGTVTEVTQDADGRDWIRVDWGTKDYVSGQVRREEIEILPAVVETTPELPALEGTVHSLVLGARHELDPHLTHIDDPDDKERIARKVVERVLRDLSTATMGEFGGGEAESLDAWRLDELADALEDGVE